VVAQPREEAAVHVGAHADLLPLMISVITGRATLKRPASFSWEFQAQVQPGLPWEKFSPLETAPITILAKVQPPTMVHSQGLIWAACCFLAM